MPTQCQKITEGFSQLKVNKGWLLQIDSVVGKDNTKSFPSTKFPYKQCKTHFHTIFYYAYGFEVDIPSQQRDLGTFTCCLPGVQVKDVTKKIPRWAQPLDY